MNAPAEVLLFGRFTPEQLSVLLEISSSVLALSVAFFYFVKEFSKQKRTDPITILAKAAGLSILPQALVFISATFDPRLLCLVQGLRVYFMISGLSLLYVCVKSVKA